MKTLRLSKIKLTKSQAHSYGLTEVRSNAALLISETVLLPQGAVCMLENEMCCCCHVAAVVGKEACDELDPRGIRQQVSGLHPGHLLAPLSVS